MSFGAPIFLLALLAVPLALGAYVWFDRRRERDTAAWTTPALLANMVAATPGRRRHVPVALFLIGASLLLVGFARPRARLSTEREGATVVLAMDVSRSMRARDVKPSRLHAAERAATAFVGKLPDKYRVGVVTFADRVYVPVPPTYDRVRVRRAIKLALLGEGTALGEAVSRSVRIANKAVQKAAPKGERPPAAVLVISDGAQTQGRTTPAQAAALAKRLRVPVSTVSLGTKNGVVTRKLEGGFVERTQVPPDPRALRTIARGSGGRFFAISDSKRLEHVYRDLGSRLAHEKKPREVSAAASGAALAFMLAGAALSGIWFRRLV